MKQTKKRKMKGRVNTSRIIARGEMSIRKEVEHIVECAQAGDVRIVTLRPLVFFSAASGDAWMLEPGDGLAIPLCRFGEPLPVNLLETSERFSVEWTHTYSIQDDCFRVLDQGSGRVTEIMGYPTRQIAQAMGQLTKLRST